VRKAASGAEYLDVTYSSSVDNKAYYNSYDDSSREQLPDSLEVFSTMDDGLKIATLSNSKVRIYDTEDYNRIVSFVDVDLIESANLDFATRDDALRTVAAMDTAIQVVMNSRAEVGSQLNRLDSAARSLETSSIQAKASRSRILDADFAQETAALTKAQILSQSSTAMIAQANAQAGMVLRLLQGF
jgi:flagellin-like hook-associated protein FlgL